MKRILAIVLFLLFGSFQYDAVAQVKYVFYFIGDGMGVNQVNAAEMYKAEQEGRLGVSRLSFTKFPYATVATTYSASNGVTDSAAAGTALATGHKTKNGTIGMDSLQQNPLQSVAERAKAAGRHVGIMSTVSVDNATPAVFYAHQPDRNMYYEIACDIPKSGFEFFGGSGFMAPDRKFDKTEAPDIHGVLEKAGYRVVRGTKGMMNIGDAEKVVLIQEQGADTSGFPYAIDRTPEDMTLPQVVSEAIEFLNKDDAGFFLMAEGGKIDWACHKNDVGTMIPELLDFSDAVQVAYEFYLKHPDETLIVVSADHETGGFVLGGTKEYQVALKNIDNQKISYNLLVTEIDALHASSWQQMKEFIENRTGLGKEIPLSEVQWKSFEEIYAQNKDNAKLGEKMADEMVKVVNGNAMVNWMTKEHSAGYVPVYAIGKGASVFTGLLNNTDIPQKIAEVAGY